MKKTKITLKTIKALTAAIILLNATNIVNKQQTITHAMFDPNAVQIPGKPTKLGNYYNEWEHLHREELDANQQNSKEFGILHTLRAHQYEDYEIFLYAARLQILPKILKDKGDNYIGKQLNQDLITASIEQAKGDNLKNIMRNNPWIFLTLEKKDTSYENLTPQEYNTIRTIFTKSFTKDHNLDAYKEEIEKIKNSNNKGQVIEALQQIYKVLIKLKNDLLYSTQQEERELMAKEISTRLTAIGEATLILEAKDEQPAEQKVDKPNEGQKDDNKEEEKPEEEKKEEGTDKEDEGNKDEQPIATKQDDLKRKIGDQMVQALITYEDVKNKRSIKLQDLEKSILNLANKLEKQSNLNAKMTELTDKIEAINKTIEPTSKQYKTIQDTQETLIQTIVNSDKLNNKLQQQLRTKIENLDEQNLALLDILKTVYIAIINSDQIELPAEANIRQLGLNLQTALTNEQKIKEQQTKDAPDLTKLHSTIADLIHILNPNKH